jgi:TIR domain
MHDRLFSNDRDWREALRFFQHIENAQTPLALNSLPPLASDLREALRHSDVQSVRSEHLQWIQASENSASRQGTLLHFLFLYTGAACAGIVCATLVGLAYFSERVELLLEAGVLLSAFGCLYLKWHLDQTLHNLREALENSACAELELFDYVIAHGTYSAQMWVAAYYWERLNGSHYAPYLSFHSVGGWKQPLPRWIESKIGGWVSLFAACALYLASFLLTVAVTVGLPLGHPLSTPALTAALIAAASLLLIVTPFLDQQVLYTARRARSRRHLKALESLRNRFFEWELGPHNVHAFVAEMIRAEIASRRPDNEARCEEAHDNPDHPTDFALLDFIEVGGTDRIRRISLYRGDLSRMPEKVDFLVVSAFPNSYAPVPGTVIESLKRKGISVSALADDKEHDLRQSCGFWVSKDLSVLHPDSGFRRLLCFEPAAIGAPPQVISELFRGMFPFLDMSRGSSVATSLIAAGSQRWGQREMFRPLVESAIEWLRRDLPVNELKIVVRSSALARSLAGELRAIAAAVPTTRLESTAPNYDLFLSYSSRDAAAARLIKEAIIAPNKNLRVFDFKNEIDIGKSYQQEIDHSIENCRKIIAVMSPSYFCSPECQEELHMARLRNKRADHSVFFPIYWQSLDTELKLWIQALNYADCRECDERKLADALKDFI